MSASIVVVGAGILGCTAALLAAQHGWSVRIVDRADRAWSGASAAGEGKIHLGLIYALGDSSTHTHIREGALAFSDVLDRAAGMPLPWNDLASEPFLNVVMPSSLLSASDLAARYHELDDGFQASEAADRATYLGRPIERLHTPGLITEPLTGLPALRVAERAIETTWLRQVLVDRIRNHPRIQLDLRRDVIALHNVGESVEVHHRDSSRADGPVTVEQADVVLNCAWESQAALHADPESVPLSIRYKASVSIPLDVIDSADCRTMSLVIGAYGDVVRRKHDVYASWYPAGRVVNEWGIAPSLEARALVASLDQSDSVVDNQLNALNELGALPRLTRAARDRVTLTGGWILAEGAREGGPNERKLHDVNDRTSALHQRRDGMIARRGRVVTPRNWKLTTAPLAAQRAVESVLAILGGDHA